MGPNRLTRFVDEVRLRGGNTRRRLDAAVERNRSQPRFWRELEAVEHPNTLFSRREAKRLRGYAQRIVHNDPTPRARVAKRRIRGVRDWEYGTLLGALADASVGRVRTALDVGSGNSTFPLYLVESGAVAAMTRLDLPGAYEGQAEENRLRDERAGILAVEGDMRNLPLPEESFDLVTCISAIEHLDGLPQAYLRDPRANPQLPYDRYVADTRQAVESMCSVVAPGGLLYLTTDAYLADRQSDDAWNPPADRIWSAYPFEEIEGLFLDAVGQAGLELIGSPDYRRELLLEDKDRSTYRGRYFTTFAILARRPGR